MKTIWITATLLWLLCTAVRAEVIDSEGRGGSIYAVEKAPEGHHWFFIVPSDHRTGGGIATVEGRKDGKVVLVFRVTNDQKFSTLSKVEGADDSWMAYSFGVNLDFVDELKMVEFIPPQTPPGGLLIQTDLLALVGRAKQEGRYKDVSIEGSDTKQAQSEQGSAGQPATHHESDSDGGDKPQPESEGSSR
jgi:hypothetical protein